MNDRFEDLLLKADFTKESDLYEDLRSNITGSKKVGFLKSRAIPDDDLEMLAAAGTTEGRFARTVVLSDTTRDADNDDD